MEGAPPLHSLMVDPIAQSFPQFHGHTRTTVIGVIFQDLPHFSFNFLLFRPGPTVTILSIVPTRFRYAQRFQTAVQASLRRKYNRASTDM